MRGLRISARAVLMRWLSPPEVLERLGLEGEDLA